MHKYIVKIGFKLILFFSVCINVRAQEFIGLRTDNYAGSNGMLLNPAMPITGKLPWDINVFALGVYEDNNYISIPENMIKFVTTADSIIDIDYFNPKKIYAHGNVLAQLPSAFFKFDDFAAGIFFTARAAGYALSENEVHGIQGIKDVPLYTNIDMPAFNAGVLVWSEIGLNAEVTLERNSVFAVHLGGNLKYLSGLEALGYENNSEFTYVRDTVNTTATHFDSDFDYTKNLGSNQLYDRSNFGINGSGVGIDVGLMYEVKKRSQFKFSKNLEYIWKFGFSIVDLGIIKYNKNSGTYHLVNEESLIVSNAELDSIDDIDEFNRAGARIIYDLSAAAKDGSSFSMYLPAAFVLSAEKSFNKNIYAQAMIVRRIPRFNTNLIARSNVFSLTPRFETRNVSFCIPMQVYEDREFRIGAAARFMFFTVGSDNLLTFTKQSEYSSINMYVGIKLNPYWLLPENRVKFLDCLKM